MDTAELLMDIFQSSYLEVMKYIVTTLICTLWDFGDAVQYAVDPLKQMHIFMKLVQESCSTYDLLIDA